MNSFEIGDCHREEYDNVRDDRFHESELAVNGLYTLMVLHTERGPQAQQAGKYPARIIDMTMLSSDGREVVIGQLNRALQPIKQKRFTVIDGFWLPKPGQLATINTRVVREAFFHAYPEDMDDETETEDTIEAETPLEREMALAGPREYNPGRQVH